MMEIASYLNWNRFAIEMLGFSSEIIVKAMQNPKKRTILKATLSLLELSANIGNTIAS